MGPSDARPSLDLGGQDYTDLQYWQEVPESQIVPSGLSIAVNNSLAVGGTVVQNKVHGGADAHIKSAETDSAALTVEAIENALIRAKIDSTVSSSGGNVMGKGQSLAINGNIATNAVLSAATAYLDSSDVTTDSGDVAITADNTSDLIAETQAATQTGDTAVGIVMAFNSVGWEADNLLSNIINEVANFDDLVGSVPDTGNHAIGAAHAEDTKAYIQDTHVASAGAVAVAATASGSIEATIGNSATSAPSAFFSANGTSVPVTLSSNRVDSKAIAFIDNGGAGHVLNLVNGKTIDAGGGVSVTAEDHASISAKSDLVSKVTLTNDAGAGLINQWAGLALNSYDFTSASGTQSVEFGDRVMVFGDGDDTHQKGKIYQYMGPANAALNLANAAAIGAPVGATNYADLELWKAIDEEKLISKGLSRLILDTAGMVTKVKGLAGDSHSYYAMVDRNDVHGGAESYIQHTKVTAHDDVRVSALEDATITVSDTSTISASEAKGGVITLNHVSSSATARIEDGDITTTTAGDVSVVAENAAFIHAEALTSAASSDGIGNAIVALNAIGIDEGNILYEAADVLIGQDLLGSVNPADTNAFIKNSTISAAEDVSVTATNVADIHSTVGDESKTTSTRAFAFDATFGASGVSTAVVFASNRVYSGAHAYIDESAGTRSVTAGGGVDVEAEDTSTIFSDSKVVVSSISTNDLSATIGLVSSLVDEGYAFTNRSIGQKVYTGDRVRLGTHATSGQAGDVYEYQGIVDETHLPLTLTGTEDYVNALDPNSPDPQHPRHFWKRVSGQTDAADLLPNLGNITELAGKRDRRPDRPQPGAECRHELHRNGDGHGQCR